MEANKFRFFEGKIYLFVVLIIISSLGLEAQDFIESGRLSGNFQIESQYYFKDSLIGSEDVSEKIRSNSFLNLIYNSSNFEVGLRYEAYQPPLLGFDVEYQGSGVPYKYVTYRSELVDVTAGDFYEQFGSGMIFRSYEERNLGIDNAIGGFRFKFRPFAGFELTGLMGKQRSFWGKGAGIVRGGDLNLNVNELAEGLLPDEFQLNLGGSIASKYQADEESTYFLPENVLAYSFRFGLIGPSYSVDGEYAYKYNDPNLTNEFSYNPGIGLILNGSYFQKGLGISLNIHHIDNMDFRSDRNSVGNVLNLNFIPPLTKLHTYRLASIYPYGTQLNGEAGIQGEITYKIPKKTSLGGKYGTTVIVNYSTVYGLDTVRIDQFTYETEIFKFGDRQYFRDFNIEVSRRWTKKFKSIFTYLSLIYNKDILEAEGSAEFGKVHADAAIVDMTYRIVDDHAVRMELQHMWARQDSTIKKPDNINGNWAMFLLEYTIAPAFFLTVIDEYNYGNDSEERQVHYPTYSFAYIHNTTRFVLAYGRQRGGLLCIGGVCREVPASNAVTFTLSSSF